MSHTLIITAYNPNFSFSFKHQIRKNINPSMINVDDSEEKAYFLQHIINEDLPRETDDEILIQELLTQNVEYVEF
jgi:hypothetical protein